MFSIQNEAQLVEDREDLIAVLRMRFGYISGKLIKKIYEIDDSSTLQRLILSAANAASWDVFLEELDAGEESFKLLGENFNPLRDSVKGREHTDGKAQ